MRKASSGEAREEDDPEVKAWDSLCRRFLEESKVDLEISYQLSKFQDEGSKRRRLFFLQQALEKCVKGSLPELGVAMKTIPLLSSSHIFAQRRSPGRPLEILMDRWQRVFNAFKNPKELNHNPAKKLEIKTFLEDCFLFAVAVGDLGWAETCLECTNLMKEQSVQKTILEIEKESRKIQEIKSQAALVKIENPRSPNPKDQARAIFSQLREFTFHDTKKSCLTLALLEQLAVYEQASRYPESSTIPNVLLDELDLVHNAIQQLVNEAVQMITEEKLFNPIELLLQRGKFSEENMRRMLASLRHASEEAQ